MEPIDPLDDLLRKAPMPEAPGWFEAKTLARLRRETEVATLLFFKRLALATCALLLGGVMLWNLSFGNNRSFEQERMFAAFDAVESYAEEEILWNAEYL